MLELEVLAYHTIGAHHEHLWQPGRCLAAYAKCEALANVAGLEGSSGLGHATAEMCSICCSLGSAGRITADLSGAGGRRHGRLSGGSRAIARGRLTSWTGAAVRRRRGTNSAIPH